MKLSRIFLISILVVLLFGLFQNAPLGQEADQYYLQREKDAEPKIKAKLNALREEIRTKNYTFQVGYTKAMDYPLEKITGLVVPQDLPELIKKQNLVVKKQLNQGLISESVTACSTNATSFDWRKNNGVTPVRDQGACGSCWDFATHGAFEGSCLVKCNKKIDSSEQDTLDCNPWGYSCNGGWWAHQYLIDKGSAKESVYPYTAVKGPCKTKARPYKADAWGYVGSTTTPSVSALKQALCKYGPLTVAVRVTTAFQAYTGGVFNACVSGNVNHGVTLIGWDDNKGAWLIKNSWGTGWGSKCGYGTEKGYMWIKYNCNKIGYGASWIQAKTCTSCK